MQDPVLSYNSFYRFAIILTHKNNIEFMMKMEILRAIKGTVIKWHLQVSKFTFRIYLDTLWIYCRIDEKIVIKCFIQFYLMTA